MDIEKLSKPKGQWCPTELKAHFLEKLSNYPHAQSVHVYCDGSVEGSKTGCGIFVRDYISQTEYTDYEVSNRLPAHISSTN